MMKAFYLTISLTIFANICYHICQKAIRSQADPICSLIVTYFVALLVSTVVFLSTRRGLTFPDAFREIGWATYALGIVIVLLEMGFLLVYRVGWDLSIAVLYSNVSVALLLLPIGTVFFREPLSLRRLVGIVLALVAIFLLSPTPSSSPE